MDWGEIVAYVVAFLLGSGLIAGFLTKAKTRIAALAELLAAFSEAIEDNRIDANERQDLVIKARELIGKKKP